MTKVPDITALVTLQFSLGRIFLASNCAIFDVFGCGENPYTNPVYVLSEVLGFEMKLAQLVVARSEW